MSVFEKKKCYIFWVPNWPDICHFFRFRFQRGGAAGFAKVLPSTRVNFANFVNLYQSKNAQLFLISILCYYSFCPLSDPVKWDPICCERA